MIHFASLFGFDLDFDLLPHWVEHYKSFGFDSYTVFLQGKNNANKLSASTLLLEQGFTIHILPDETYTTALRARTLKKFTEEKDPYDYIVIADSDEFHDIPVESYRHMIPEFAAIKGSLADRWDTTLHDADPFKPLPSQYPFEGNIYDLLPAYFPDRSRDKILAYRANIAVSYAGHHRVLETCNIAEDYAVMHYPWRKSAYNRMATKTYYTADHMKAVQEFFKDNDNSVIEQQEKRDDQMIACKGWM